MTRQLELLPSPTPLDVDLAAEAALPFLLEIIREHRAARPQLHLVTTEDPAADASVRSVSQVE